MRAPRLIAVDLDGTVLGPGKHIAPAGRAALGRAAGAGVTVALASGRMLRSTALVQAALGLRGPIIAYNGGMVRLEDGRGWEDPVPLAAARTVAAVCRQSSLFLQAYYGDELCVPVDEARARAYSELAGVPFRVDPESVWQPSQPPTKLLIIEPAERQPAVRAAVRAAVDGTLELSNSYPHYLEISRAGVNKGVALERLAEALGIARADVAAVGDGENDLSMIRFAGRGVAVQNAAASLREAAAFVTQAPFGEGVAEAVEALLSGAEPAGA